MNRSFIRFESISAADRPEVAGFENRLAVAKRAVVFEEAERAVAFGIAESIGMGDAGTGECNCGTLRAERVGATVWGGRK